MTVCRSCGWEIKADAYGLWIDAHEQYICQWNEDLPIEHNPLPKSKKAEASFSLPESLIGLSLA